VIAILDYKAGNLASVKKAFDALGAPTVVTSDPIVARAATKIVLPGVGHFAATAMLEDLGLAKGVRDAIRDGVPFLGICVGMQWLFGGSAEAPGVAGLGLFEGSCQRFPRNGLKCPHVGWNSVEVCDGSRLFAGIDEQSPFAYFTHSFYVDALPATSVTSEYGVRFSAAVERDNVFGVQFHPEKSGALGLQVLRNFTELPC
jgi:imidazole glycerol-phosphate synthase subunit HisH